MSPTKPELLSPAGSMDSLRAALAAGADAVYFGGQAFSNRMRAKNFDSESIADAIKLCHSAGAKAYITVNTRVRDREMTDLLQFAESILTPSDPCDALIMADFGAALEIKRRFPEVTLHASTQTSLSSASDCAALAELGFSRLVVPRELSLDEIRALASSTETELEMFIHGAHCVSLSGQCLLSAVMGGRSGNRGECAQPCRLPYSDGYPLSLADMCLAGRMRDVLSSGVRSLKIEGRLKPAGYVHGVTRVYRRLIDEGRDATAEEIEYLASLFTRGFTDGYFTKKYTSMSGRKNSGSAEISAGVVNAALSERIKAEKANDALPITAKLTLKSGEGARLTLSSSGISVTEVGDIPAIATGRPIDEEGAARYITKLGGTGLRLSESDLECDIDSGLWMGAASLNELRRRAATALCEATKKREKSKDNSGKSLPIRINFDEIPAETERGAKLCVLETADAAVLAARGGFDRVYAQVWDYERVKNALSGAGCTSEICAVLPPLTPDDSALKDALEKLKKSGCRRVMCNTAGQVRLSSACGFVCDMSFRANVTNTPAYRYYKAIGCKTVVLSPELPEGAVRAIGGSGIVYGRLPLMHLSRCLNLKKSPGSAKKCAHGRRSADSAACADCVELCRGELVDRKAAVFPVLGLPDCVNVVYNSVVTDRTASLAELNWRGGYVWYLL